MLHCKEKTLDEHLKKLKCEKNLHRCHKKCEKGKSFGTEQPASE